MRIESRAQVPPALALAAPVIAAIVTLALAAVIFVVAGTSVGHGYKLMITGAFGSLPALRATSTHAVPLVLTGLAAALSFRIKLWNLGAEGQFLAGALTALTLGAGTIALPGFLLLPLVLVAGALAGALMMLVPLVLKVWRGSNEAVVTLLINVMMLMLLPALLAGPLAGADGQPRALAASALLPRFDWLLGVHAGLLIALVAVVAIWVALPFTIWGFMLRATAGNPVAARLAGINVDRVTVSVGLVSGALAGLAGAIALTAQAGSVTPGFGAGIGYAGIAVAVLADRSLPGILVAAIFIAALQTGIEASPHDGAPTHAADILIALVLIFALIAGTLVRFRLRPRQQVPA